MYLKKIIPLLLFLIISGCKTTPVDLTTPGSPDELLYYEVYGEMDELKSPTIIFYLPGDTGSKGGLDNRYFFREAKISSSMFKNTLTVAILRPGTHDELGNKSHGLNNNNDDNKTHSNIASVARTIEHIKNKYNPNIAIGVGHSGGAMTLGVIIGQYPNLLDSVVLTSGVCDIPEYRFQRRGRNTWINSLSSKNYVEGIPQTTKVRIISGDQDSNVLPMFAQECYEIYKNAGLNAELMLVKGAEHSFQSSLRNAVRKTVKTLVE